MIDPREIEGSPERAADRGREEDLGFLVSDRPSLGNPDVVRGLVSEFASSIVDVRKRYNQGKLSGEDAQDEIRGLAVEYGKIVLGKDDRFASLPWNRPGGLGRRIQLTTPAIDGVDDPGEQLFLTVGASLVDLAQMLENDRMSEDDARAKVEDMLEDVVQLILGTR